MKLMPCKRARQKQLAAGELDAGATVLRFFYVDSPPPLTVGLFFIHNHADGTYSGAHSTPWGVQACYDMFSKHAILCLARRRT